jgi:maltoporin
VFSALVSSVSFAEEPLVIAPGVDALGGRFEFGSYGRLGVGSDLTGRLGANANVVAHGPRLIEDGYAELELRREDTFGPVKSRVVTTVAFFAPFFHFSGDVTQHIALRNLYAEGTLGDFSLWAGSRMYRGDDVYLLNFWPLDDLNTVGGGFGWKLGANTTLQGHVGMQRLDLPSQSQAILSNNPLGFGTVSVARLDRPRMIESVKLLHEIKAGAGGFKASLYGEGHQIGAGVMRNTSTGDESVLPADWGLVLGGQLSAWLPDNRYLHFWVRHAIGLGVYDELTTPSSTANDKTTQGANSTRVALAGGWDTAHVGLLLGAYVDLVRDAGLSTVTAQKYDEGAFSVRGQWYATKYFGLAAEASYQRRVYSLVDPATGALRSGGVTQFGVMPYFSPLGQGLFNRPQLRLVYALSLRDAGARSFYAVDDVASQRGVEHYVGVSVEWWFNASTYPVR